jgi:predicted transposase/invertase (TIGR01784 family)
MPIGISPLVDYALKMLLANEDHINILIHFLNTMLVGQPQVLSVTIKNPIQNKSKADDKLSILDILAVDELGRHLNIEVQTSIPPGMAKRLAYYTCVSYSRQLKKGQNYLALRPSISICVLNGAMFSKPRRLHEEFRLQSTTSKLTLTDDLQIHLLQLNHLQVTAERLYNATAVERWAWFLRNVDQISVQDVARLFPDQVFSEAAGVLQMISKTPEQLMAYDARLKYQRDQAARMQAEEEAKEQHRVTMSQLQATESQLKAAETQLQVVAADAQAARTEARIAKTQGLAIGQLRGQIILLQKLLRERVWTEQDFESCDVHQLQAYADELQLRLENRGT